MGDSTIKILVVDDIPKAVEFFGRKNLPGTCVPILKDENQVTFKSVSDKLSSLTPEDNIKLLLVNAHFGKNHRWKFQGIDLVWSMRGCARPKTLDEPIGIRNPSLLTLPVIIYSVLDQKYLVAYSIHEFGQSIFDIPYARPLCEYVCLVQSKQQIQAILSQKILKLLAIECDAVDIGIDVYQTRLKLLTEYFVDRFRHNIRNPLQENRVEKVKVAKDEINKIIRQIDESIGGINLSDDSLSQVVSKISGLLQPYVQDNKTVPPSVKDQIVQHQESVIHTPHLFSLYAVNISSFLNPNLPQKTGIMIIEDECKTAKDYQRKLVRCMGFAEEQVVLITEPENHYPDKVIEKIKEKQKESIRIKIAIVDLILRTGEKAGIDILRKIKFEFPRIRIVVISGRNDVQFEALSHGADYYITKPILAWEQDFCSIIREALYWKRVLLLETEQTHRENLQMVKPFRRSNDGIKTEDRKYTKILKNIAYYFASHWIHFEPRIIGDEISEDLAEKIEDGRYDLIILDGFAQEDKEWELGKRLFKQIRRLHREVPIIILASAGIEGLKNKLIFHELKHHFRIDYDRFWVKPLSFERLRQIKEIFQQQSLIKYDVRYTLLLPKKYSDGKFLFSIRREYQGELKNGKKVSRGLLRKLKENKIFLSRDATILVKEQGILWQISDGNQTYSIKKEQNKLNIYDGEAITPEHQKENESLKNKYLECISKDFGGATIWEGEGSWWRSAHAQLIKDDQYILYVLTRYAPGNREKLLKIIRDYAKETNQQVIFLEEEQVSTYEISFGG